jgi:hypothetical protein
VAAKAKSKGEEIREQTPGARRIGATVKITSCGEQAFHQHSKLMMTYDARHYG